MSTATQQYIKLQDRPASLLPVGGRLATPQILRIDRYRLKAGMEIPVQHLQQQVARAMARWGAPHPCLAVESLTGPKEVWRLTGYQSSAEQRRLAQSLEANNSLRMALERIESQIQVLIGSPATLVAHYCGATRRSDLWPMGRGHYLVVAPLSGPDERLGASYQASDGIRYGISAARTRSIADARAAEAGPAANVFAVRPSWCVPSPDWMRSDLAFWNSNPVVKRSAMACTVLGAR